MINFFKSEEISKELKDSIKKNDEKIKQKLEQKKIKSNKIKGFHSKSVHKLSVIDSSGDSDVRGTPPEKFMYACRKLNFYPSIDYAGDILHHVVTDYITEEKNSLSIDWTKNGFLNPPYKWNYNFLDHVVKMWKRYDINILVLTFTSTGSNWWQDHVEPYRETGEVKLIFQNKRLRFSDELGWVMKNYATDDSVWILYKSKLFPHETFSPFPYQDWIPQYDTANKK